MIRFKPFLFVLALSLSVCAPSFQAGVASAQESQHMWGRRPVYGPFRVDVLVGGRPLDILQARGRRYVEALENEEYELRVYNPLPVRVAVALSVDGLNTIDARRTASWDASKWVIEPYQTIHVSGWQMSSNRARRFYFTTERDSYAAKLGRAADLGVITAVFYREEAAATTVVPSPRYEDRVRPQKRSEDGAKPRSGESQMESRAGRSAGNTASAPPPRPDDQHAATGIGRSVRHDVTWINMRLDRRPAAEFSVRYEYRDALVRLGVLPRPRPYDEDPLRRRERARGFEDSRYSPEP
jgi:hypothetical protein